MYGRVETARTADRSQYLAPPSVGTAQPCQRLHSLTPHTAIVPERTLACGAFRTDPARPVRHASFATELPRVENQFSKSRGATPIVIVAPLLVAVTLPVKSRYCVNPLGTVYEVVPAVFQTASAL